MAIRSSLSIDRPISDTLDALVKLREEQLTEYSEEEIAAGPISEGRADTLALLFYCATHFNAWQLNALLDQARLIDGATTEHGHQRRSLFELVGSREHAGYVSLYGRVIRGLALAADEVVGWDRPRDDDHDSPLAS